jgi:acetyl-CoA carboxylase biotin carboxyl carrier protein
VDPRDLKRLLDTLVQADVSEFNLETADYKLHLKRGLIATPTALAAAPVAAAPSAVVEAVPAPVATLPLVVPVEAVAAASAAPVVAPAAVATGKPLKAPIVGTFYRSSSPESPAFVQVGDRVEVGKVLCIIEAMKLMNEIEAEFTGVVREISVQNAQPVEYGQTLFMIEPV